MDLDTKSSEKRASVLILYASQTGTSQEVAGDVARSLRKLQYSCRVSSFSDYNIVRISFELQFKLLFKPYFANYIVIGLQYSNKSAMKS
jgi:sulfite reductase alpha subunit-like flavoprotein